MARLGKDTPRPDAAARPGRWYAKPPTAALGLLLSRALISESADEHWQAPPTSPLPHALPGSEKPWGVWGATPTRLLDLEPDRAHGLHASWRGKDLRRQTGHMGYMLPLAETREWIETDFVVEVP